MSEWTIGPSNLVVFVLTGSGFPGLSAGDFLLPPPEDGNSTWDHFSLLNRFSVNELWPSPVGTTTPSLLSFVMGGVL